MYNQVVGIGILVVVTDPSSTAAYTNTTKVRELVSGKFLITTTYSNDLFVDVKENEWFIKGVSLVSDLSLM